VRSKTTPAFDSDSSSLMENEKQLFRASVKVFNNACDRFVESGASFRRPASLREKKVQGAAGVWEMTWSFAGPEGRATWQWDTVEDASGTRPAVLWRRVRGHASSR
jgi:hypothetical protein